MYILKKNAIHVPFSLTTRSKTADNEEALLDSGATHNFIDKQMAKRLKKTGPLNTRHNPKQTSLGVFRPLLVCNCYDSSPIYTYFLTLLT